MVINFITYFTHDSMTEIKESWYSFGEGIGIARPSLTKILILHGHYQMIISFCSPSELQFVLE